MNNIEWTLCSERMPPDDDNEIIVRDIPTDYIQVMTGHNLKILQDHWKDNEETEWTIRTQVKLEFLNR